MRKITMALAALLLACGAAGADDWSGAVKMQASYDIPNDNTAPEVNLTIDVVYDRAGRNGAAWGTMSYQRRAQGNYEALQLYYHALCVGRFEGGNKYSVAGPLAKSVGIAPLKYATFELDIVNKTWRIFETDNEQDARATCKTQSGLFPGTFNHGYVIAK